MVAEPYSVPSHPRWFGDEGGSTAIYWSGTVTDSTCTLIMNGRGYVAVAYGTLAVVGCYISPNCSLAAFEAYLDGLSSCIRACYPRPVLVLGDFNAHSRAWGNSQDNARGDVLLEWAASADLRLLNHGSVSTCVRWQGESVVDLSWATPAAVRLISGWKVAEDLVTLSDHRHIIIEVDRFLAGNTQRAPSAHWSVKRLDRDKLIAAANVVDWLQSSREVTTLITDETASFQAAMVDICDAAMPRAKPFNRRSAYWWTDEIAELRQRCLQTRRHYTRTRRRRRSNAVEIETAYVAYRNATRVLQAAIANAKARSWTELIDQLNGDPWGRPYKMVLGKLRPWVPPLTESMDPEFLHTVIENLFPRDRLQDISSRGQNMSESNEWHDEWAVSKAEFDRAVDRLLTKKTAPGPDGIPGRALALALTVVGDRLRQLFTRCLRQGKFPAQWKVGKMVLLRKEGRAADNPSAYRPICLLDEAGKLLEKIVAERLLKHLSQSGPNYADSQYGFRKGRSTVDAILRVRTISQDAVKQGKVALAISLDIVNAFNSLPFRAIRQALVSHRVPCYLRKVIEDYLRDRLIQWRGRDSQICERVIQCGVPQGSVLGPHLWNLAYDAVLRVELPVGVHVICYADDTLIVAVGDSFEDTIRLAELGTAYIVQKIHGLGLRVAPQKTEAIWFHNLPRGCDPPNVSITVDNVQVNIRRYMKYLGLTLDSKWEFKEHFNRLIPRLEKVMGALHRLLPNLGGPNEPVRRLYGGVIRSIALYASPVWSNSLDKDRNSRKLLNGFQRRMAIRICRGYRTISHEAALLIARSPPIDILAGMNANTYRMIRDTCSTDDPTSRNTMRQRMLSQALAQWRTRLENSNAALQRAPGAILPNFKSWMERKWSVTYRLTQILTGHGCFGVYLNRIGRETTPQCHHCSSDRDDAQHTLEECPAWSNERMVLIAKVGRDLSPANIVRAMLHDAGAWKAMVSFCESVMRQKENAERERERGDPTRRRRRRPRN